jgi:hypothetical protein
MPLLASALILLATGQLAKLGPQSGHTLVYYGPKKNVLLIGGESDSAKKIWTREGEGWKIASHNGLHRSLPAVASGFDPEVVVLFGGAFPTPIDAGNNLWTVTSETWTYDGNLWKLITKEGPAARDHHAMAYDSDRKKMVMFGGGDADPSGRALWYGDTWEFDGQAWTKKSETGPFARAHHAMAYDPIRHQTVLAGGFGPNGKVDPQTWVWNGESWRAATASGPGARISPRMVFHPGLGKIILFGGETLANLPHDTWAWDGFKWEKIADDGPLGRTVHAMAYDPERKVIVMYGGTTTYSVDDLWEFGDEGWKRIGGPKKP